MKAITWHGKHDVRCETVDDPEILNPRDAIIRITSTAICGSDLHLYDHTIPGMKHGDILGHEFMGEVVEVGSGNKKLKVGQRVVVPFVIACGKCFFCQKQQFAACDNSNPADKSDPSEFAYGYPMAAAFGYSHLTGGYSGGRPSSRVSRTRTSGPSSFPMTSRTTRSCSFRTSCPRAGWPQSIATSSPETSSPCGAAARWDCSRSRAHSCWARTA